MGRGNVGLGRDDTGFFTDFYAYDPDLNQWDPVLDFGGTARAFAVSFTIDGMAYVGTGLDALDEQKDFWKYDPLLNSWTQVADSPPDPRQQGVAFSIGDKGYVSGGFYIDGGTFQLSDVQEYDPVNNVWTERIFADGINLSFLGASSFVLDSIAYILYGNQDHIATYDPKTNTVDNLGDQLNLNDNRANPIGFSIGEEGFFGLGIATPSGLTSVFENDFWRYGLPPAPEAPSGLMVDSNTGSSITISWTDNSQFETSFIIERSTDDVTFEVLGTVSANVKTFTDATILPDITYYYRVNASNLSGDSPYSNVVSFLVVNTAPTDLTLAGNSISEVAEAGTVVGRFVIEDENNDATIVQLVSGDGTNDVDNGAFLIEGDLLKTNEPLDFATKNDLKIFVQANDAAGETISKGFTVNVKEGLGTAKVFYTSFDSRRMESVDLFDGTIDTLLSGHRVDAYELVSSREAVYWLDGANNQIISVSYDLQTTETIIDDLSENARFFFVDESENKLFVIDSEEVVSYDLNGDNRQQIAQLDVDFFSDVQFDEINNDFYWISQDSIFQLKTSNNEINSTFAPNARSLQLDPGNNAVFVVNQFIPQDLDYIYQLNMNDFTSDSVLVVDDYGIIRDFLVNVNDQKLYIFGDSLDASGFSSDIIEVNYDGSDEKIIYDGSLDLDDGVLDQVNNQIYWVSRLSDRIFRANLDGTSLDTLHFANFGEDRFKLDVTNDVIVISFDVAGVNGAEELKIGAISNRDVTERFTPDELDDPVGFYLDEERGKMYIPERSKNAIFESELDGSGYKIMIDSIDGPGAAKLDDIHSKLYWTSEWGSSSGSNNSGARIWRANLDGSDREVIVDRGGLTPGFELDFGLDAENEIIYWFSHLEKQIMKMDVESGEISDVMSFDQEERLQYVDFKDGKLFMGLSFPQDILFQIDLISQEVTEIAGGSRRVFLDKNHDRSYSISSSSIKIRDQGQDQFNFFPFNITFGNHRQGEVYSIENSQPSEFTLSNTSITEDKGPFALVGILETVDENVDDSHTYKLLETGDFEVFEIDEDQLISINSLDFEIKSSFTVSIRSTDNLGGFVENEFMITVKDTIDNRAPTELFLTNNTIPAFTQAGTEVGVLSTSDPDGNQTFTYSMEENDDFLISGDKLVVERDLTLENTTVNLTITTTDQGGLSFSMGFDILIESVPLSSPEELGIEIYPNPASSEFSINGLTEGEILYLINLNGQSVREISSKGLFNKIDVRPLPRGVYFLKTTNSEGYFRVVLD